MHDIRSNYDNNMYNTSKGTQEKKKKNMLKLILAQNSMEFEFHLVSIPHLNPMSFF